MKKLKLFVFLLTACWLAACEKSIDFDLTDNEPKLVVEATIENDVSPIVVLTTSLNYFSALSTAQLANSFVHDAIITISNGRTTHQLIEYSLPLSGGYILYYYSNDPSHPQTAFKGELNTTYNLQITVKGKVYTAQTTIPKIGKDVKGIAWKPAPSGVDSTKASVLIKATDPQGYGDYVRYFTKRNSEPFLPGLNSVFDDLFVDGTTYELQVEPGWNRNVQREEEDLFFSRGDTVILKLSSIDKATYDFWRTMEYSYASVGNPFSTPVKISSNISGGALGYFGGYASQYHTIIIPQ